MGTVKAGRRAVIVAPPRGWQRRFRDHLRVSLAVPALALATTAYRPGSHEPGVTGDGHTGSVGAGGCNSLRPSDGGDRGLLRERCWTTPTWA
jgi:hypothetical protein